MASAADKLNSAGKPWLKVNMLQVCHCRAVQTAMVFHVSMCITGVHIRMSNIEVDCNFKEWPQKDAQADVGPTVKADSVPHQQQSLQLALESWYILSRLLIAPESRRAAAPVWPVSRRSVHFWPAESAESPLTPLSWSLLVAGWCLDPRVTVCGISRFLLVMRLGVHAYVCAGTAGRQGRLLHASASVPLES